MDAMDIDGGDLRPTKRQKIVDCTPMDMAITPFEALPAPVLLLSLSNLLLHPPTHKQYSKSLYLSFLATWRCLTYRNLDQDVECRAWTALAELGLRLGLEELDMESQVETAITKALHLVQNHPSLRPYKVHLTMLSARISHRQRKYKLSQTSIRRLLSGWITPQDLPHLVYTAHLGYIASFNTADGVPSLQSLRAIQDMNDVASGNNHHNITKLTSVLRLQTLIQMGEWDDVHEALNEVEGLFDFPTSLPESAASFAHTKRPVFHTALLVYALTLGVIFYTYTGATPSVEARTKVLHEMLDGGVLDLFKYGIIEIPFTSSQPLHIQISQPRVLMVLAFLITSIAKRDPVGRKPKRKIFAMEGLVVVEKELRKDANLAPWASAAEVAAHYSRLNKLKADLICELIGVAVMRSEFVEAERHIAELIAHARSEGLFSLYSARIALLHAQLAHGLNQTDRALQCYQVSAFLSRKRSSPVEDDEGVEDIWINTAARAGEVWLKIGILRRDTASCPPESVNVEHIKKQEESLRRLAENVIADCEGLGNTLNSVGCLLKACLTNEFLKAKTHLRQGLQLVTQSTDNHLRALIMALIASQYLNTSTEHAEAMLATAEQLAAGLGAQPRAPKNQAQDDGKVKARSVDGVGNAALRLWIGERSSELKRRAGDEEAARVQDNLNHKLKMVVQKIELRKQPSLATPVKR